MKIISFATKDDHYIPYAKRLSRQCEEFGLDYDIEMVEPWADTPREHCLYKPQFIERKLTGPVLWVDVDSILINKPVIKSDCDVGFCENPFKFNPVTAGLIFFNPTDGARRFLSHWKKLCGRWKKGQYGDHRRLCMTRGRVKYKEGDITPFLKGRIILVGVKGKDARRI